MIINKKGMSKLIFNSSNIVNKVNNFIKPIFDKLTSRETIEASKLISGNGFYTDSYEPILDTYLKKTKKSGYELLSNFRQSLSDFRTEWSEAQEKFIDLFEKSIIVQLFKDELSQCANDIMKKNNWKDLNSFLLIKTARRMGKTTAVCACAAALLLVCPFIKIAMVAPALPLCHENQELIMTFIAKIEGGVDMITHYNDKKMVLRGNEGITDLRTLRLVSNSANVSKKKSNYLFIYIYLSISIFFY